MLELDCASHKARSGLNENYECTGNIAHSTLRPDILISSNSLKCAILVELTCPCEENIGTWHSVKLQKHQ